MNFLKTLLNRFPLSIFFIIAWGTFFAGSYMMALIPSDWWALFLYGPFAGAFFITLHNNGRKGLKKWLGRIVKWRVGLRWYLVALLLPFGLQIISFGCDLLLGVSMPTSDQFNNWPDLIAQFIFIFLFIGLAEEPGFRGFALQRLLNGRSPLRASLYLGVLHTIWHLPLFATNSEPITIIPIILSGAIILGWLYLNTNGSVLLTMLMHASVNTAAGYFSSFFSGIEKEQHTIILAVLYIVTALILVVSTGSNLVRKPHHIKVRNNRNWLFDLSRQKFTL